MVILNLINIRVVNYSKTLIDLIDFALQFQIEFAGHKSCVIPLGEPVNKEKCGN